MNDIRLAEVWAVRSQELGVNQADAARSLGFRSQAAVSQYLSGRVPLGLDAACRFARFLKVPLSQISQSYADLVAGALLSESDDLTRSVLLSSMPVLQQEDSKIFFEKVSEISGDGVYLIDIKGESVVATVKVEENRISVSGADRQFSLPKETADLLQVRGRAIARLTRL